jgi:hypothetical protein
MIIYAKQVNPAYQISPMFEDSFFDDPLDFAIFGNKDYQERVPAHMRDVIYYLDSVDIESVEDINSYFPGARKKTENKILLELCKEYQNNFDIETFCKIYSLITGEKWTYTTIRGCSQREWQYFLYIHSHYSNDSLHRIEVEYFNYGTQWIIENGEYEGVSIYCISLDFDNIKKEIREELQLESSDIIVLKTFTIMKCIKYVEV